MPTNINVFPSYTANSAHVASTCPGIPLTPTCLYPRPLQLPSSATSHPSSCARPLQRPVYTESTWRQYIRNNFLNEKYLFFFLTQKNVFKELFYPQSIRWDWNMMSTHARWTGEVSKLSWPWRLGTGCVTRSLFCLNVQHWLPSQSHLQGNRTFTHYFPSAVCHSLPGYVRITLQARWPLNLPEK